MNHETEILVDSNVIFSALYKIASIPGLIIYLGILKKIKLYHLKVSAMRSFESSNINWLTLIRK